MSEEKKPQSLADFDVLIEKMREGDYPKTYTVSGMCSNCGAGYTHEFPKGQRVFQKSCPRCGCMV